MASRGRYLLPGLGFLMATLAGHGSAQVASPAAAAFPAEKTIQSWLLAEDPRLQAWGAHDAMVARDRHLVRDLLTLASKWEPPSGGDADGSSAAELAQRQTDKRDAMAAVLDALIQMHARVPDDTLRSLAPSFGIDVAILLSRMPEDEAEPLSVDFYRSSRSGALQYVSAALLALHPPPGFAADLLGNMTVRATVFVVSPGMGANGTATAGSCAEPSVASHKDWPATGQYALTRTKRDGGMLVVGGVDPIYATREEATTYVGDRCRMSWGVNLGPNDRVRLIAEMLGVSPESLRWDAVPVTNIAFQSPEQFGNALLGFAEGERQKHRATVSALAARGLMTTLEAEDTETLPRIQLQLNDMRRARDMPLPELANLPPRVEVHGPIF